MRKETGVQRVWQSGRGDDFARWRRVKRNASVISYEVSKGRKTDLFHLITDVQLVWVEEQQDEVTS